MHNFNWLWFFFEKYSRIKPNKNKDLIHFVQMHISLYAVKKKPMIHIIGVLINLSLVNAIDFSNKTPVPVVIWHGMGDSCCNPNSMGRFKSIIQDNIKNVYIHSIQIGNNIYDVSLRYSLNFNSSNLKDSSSFKGHIEWLFYGQQHKSK